jgi:integrase
VSGAANPQRGNWGRSFEGDPEPPSTTSGMQPLDVSTTASGCDSARHTYASRLIEQGEPLAYVRDQLDPHSIKITADVYGHWGP